MKLCVFGRVEWSSYLVLVWNERVDIKVINLFSLRLVLEILELRLSCDVIDVCFLIFIIF